MLCSLTRAAIDAAPGTRQSWCRARHNIRGALEMRFAPGVRAGRSAGDDEGDVSSVRNRGIGAENDEDEGSSATCYRHGRRT